MWRRIVNAINIASYPRNGKSGRFEYKLVAIRQA